MIQGNFSYFRVEIIIFRVRLRVGRTPSQDYFPSTRFFTPII
jgi:hypothetical protein